MFEFKVDGALDIGNSGVKIVLFKNKKIEKIDFEKYQNMDEEKILMLQESLENLSTRVKLKGKSLIVTIPASKFNAKTLEYHDVKDEDLEERIEDDLEELILGYTKDEFLTQIEIINEEDSYKKLLVVAIPLEEIEKILEILKHFKIRVLKLIPDFIALNNLVDVIEQKTEEKKIGENIMIVDIGGETSKIFISNLGTLNMLRIIGVGGNDFTEVIKDHEMLEFKAAELEKQELELGDDGLREFKSQGEVAMFKDLTLLLNDLITQIENSIEYFNSNLKDGKIDKIYLTGGGAMMKGFKIYFEKAFDIPCHEITFDLLNLEYKKGEEKNMISQYLTSTLIGSLIKEVM